MSSRTVPRFALTALFAAALAAPGVAQEPRPQAPMPRAKGEGVRIVVPQLGPVGLALDVDVSLNRGAAENRQVFNFAIGLFGAPDPVAVAPMPRVRSREALYDFRPAEPLAPVAFPLAAPPDGPAARGPQPIAVGPAVVREARTGSFLVGAGGIGTHPFPVVPPPARGLIVLASDVCPPCPLPVVVNPLNGTWYRDLGATVVAVTFAGDEMTVRAACREGDVRFVATFTAHCTVTKDGLVYGAITSADVDMKEGDARGMELAELSLVLQELTDAPFSFRAKATSSGLMVSHLKTAGPEGIRGKELMAFGGLYKQAKDGKVPEPKAVKAAVGRCNAGAACEVPIGAPVPPAVERIGVDFGAPAAPMTPPSAMPLEKVGFRTVGPACPPAAGDATKQMAFDAFQQMICDKDRCAGVTLPSPWYLEHYPQYFAPDPAFPLPRELAAQEDPAGAARRGGGCCASGHHVAVQAVVTPFAATAAAKPGVVGTWVRDIGTKRCVVKIAPEHLTVTVSEAFEVGGKTFASHLTVTADYHIARDGLTAVGLVTGVDTHCDGAFPDGESDAMTQWVGELRRALEDKPLALTLRPYGDALVIGNVRMPSVGGMMEAEPSALVGGRYRPIGDKPLPALRAVKESRPAPVLCFPGSALANPPGGFGPPLPCPTAPYSVPVPSGVVQGLTLPPGSASPQGAPLGDLLPPENLKIPTRPAPAPSAPVTLPPIPMSETNATVPTVPAVRVVTVPEPVPTMTAPTAPVPTMPQPTAPAEVVAVKAKKQKYSANPNVRIQQLLYQSEDLRQIHNEWRRFWFNDTPSHLTPERIHGPILP